MKKIVSLSIFVLLFICATAQIDERVEKSFNTGSTPELSIKNSFGDIKINTHKSNIIEVLVEINVVPSNKRNYEKVKDRVSIDIKEIGNRVELRTISELKGISTEAMSIDYTVLIPENTSMEIYNQFGDVWIEGTRGSLKARIHHGDLFAGAVLGNDGSIKVQFGELRLESIQNAELEVQHGDLQADALANVELEIQFSDARINQVSGNMEISVQHSDLRIEKVGKDAMVINIDGQFSDIKIESGAWSDFRMDLEGSFTDFSIPDMVKSMINFKSKDMHTIEYRINEKVTGKRIAIDANHSDVDID